MGWAFCGTDDLGREIGYGVTHDALVLADPTIRCDHPECDEPLLDRGLDYACGGMHGEGGIAGQPGCPRYFCDKHHHAQAHDCPDMEAWKAFWKADEEAWFGAEA